MTRTHGQVFWTFAYVNLLALFILVIGMGSSVHAVEHADGQTSVIAPRLLVHVDQLLQTHRVEKSDLSLIPLGPLAKQADPNDSFGVQLIDPSEDALDIAAVPLPGAFWMGLVLLGLMWLVLIYHRKHLAM